MPGAVAPTAIPRQDHRCRTRNSTPFSRRLRSDDGVRTRASSLASARRHTQGWRPALVHVRAAGPESYQPRPREAICGERSLPSIAAREAEYVGGTPYRTYARGRWGRPPVPRGSLGHVSLACPHIPRASARHKRLGTHVRTIAITSETVGLGGFIPLGVRVSQRPRSPADATHRRRPPCSVER